MKTLLPSLFLMVACGQEQLPEQQMKTETTETLSKKEQSQKKALEGCEIEETIDGLIVSCGGKAAYIKHGKDGKNGKDGLKGNDGLDGNDGKDGSKGDKGDQGIAGIDGQDAEACEARQLENGAEIECGGKVAKVMDGSKGINGVDGESGLDGQDGQNGLQINLIHQNQIIGSLFWLDDFSGDYWLIAEDNSRIAIQKSTGDLEYGSFYYELPNCSGEVRWVNGNGLYTQVAKNNHNNQVYKKQNSNLGSFPYQSRVTEEQNCSNVSATLTESYAVDAYTVPFSLPVSDLKLEIAD